MSKKRKRYDDKFRASAVVMLESLGYPEKKGALKKVATHYNMPVSTLHSWYKAKHNPVPSELRTEKRADLVALLKDEAHRLLGDMKGDGSRSEAPYRDKGVVLGIILDKLQLLQDKPTDILDVHTTGDAARDTFLGRIDRIIEIEDGDTNGRALPQ